MDSPGSTSIINASSNNNICSNSNERGNNGKIIPRWTHQGILKGSRDYPCRPKMPTAAKQRPQYDLRATLRTQDNTETNP
eukprot:4407035-Pyramimonas_sp.AAC.1